MILRAKVVAYPFHLEPQKVLVKLYYACEEMSEEGYKKDDGKKFGGSGYLSFKNENKDASKRSMGFSFTDNQSEAASWRSVIGADMISDNIRRIHRVASDTFEGAYIEFFIDDKEDAKHRLGEIIDVALYDLQGANGTNMEARDVRPAGDSDES